MTKLIIYLLFQSAKEVLNRFNQYYDELNKNNQIRTDISVE